MPTVDSSIQGVKAENAAVVGNRIDADIVGANSIGMKSVWFRSTTISKQ